MQLVSTTRVEGTITGPDGAPAAGVAVRASRTVAAPVEEYDYDYGGSATASDAQGRFAVSGLTPGSYVISARKPPALWASAELTAQGDDAVVSLMLAPGTTVSGRIVADATSGTAAPPLPDYTRARVTLAPVGPSPTASAIGMPLQADGQFSLVGVSPGRYRLTASLGVPASERWFVRSAMINGQEALDAVEIRPGAEIGDAVITVTDRPTEVSGRMTDAGNNPAPEYFIILFPADRSLWTTGARRIRQVRPSRDGTFGFKNLPAGDIPPRRGHRRRTR